MCFHLNLWYFVQPLRPLSLYGYFVVNDWCAGARERDGGDTSDKLPHLNTTLDLGIPREGPEERVDHIAWYILFQLIILCGVCVCVCVCVRCVYVCVRGVCVREVCVCGVCVCVCV